jgi:hypothetical protein
VKTIIVYYEKNNCSTYFRSPKVLWGNPKML